MAIATISPKQLHEKILAGESIELIDVRTPAEYQEVHVCCAKNIPLDQLPASSLVSARMGSSQPLYLICRSGNRAKQACEKIAQAGFTNVVNVEGGTMGWDQAGLPVQRGAKTMSLERQVRIAAGLLVLTGSLLTAFVHHYWIVLPAFIGSGLIFAGVTDSCAMGMMLARMPWNRARAETCRTS